MRMVMLVIVLGLLTGCYTTTYGYRGGSDSGIYADSTKRQKWNAFEQRWENAGPNSKIGWNAFEQVWEYGE